MRYLLVALIATILGPMAGHTQQNPVRVLSITNGQQLLVEVEDHGRGVLLACLQAPRFPKEPWAKFAQPLFEGHVKEAIRHHLSFDHGM